MVDFALSDTQRQLRHVAREFARNEIRSIAPELDRRADPTESHAGDLYRKGNALGFNAALIPEAYGGAGLGDLDFAIVLEEIAWGDAGVALTYLGHWLALSPIIKGGSDDQRRRWLSRIIDANRGSGLAAICATEHGVAGDLTPREYLGAGAGDGSIQPQDFFTNYTLPRSEQREMTTRALRAGDDFVISGTKRFITNGPIADVYLCLATVDPSQPDALATRAFVVPAGAPGLSIGTIENKMGHRLSITSEIIFDGVRVPAEDMLPGGSAALRFGLENSNTMVGALSVGLARAAYEDAMAYAKVRYKGGNRIIFHQAVGLALADMAIAIKTARLLVYQSAWHNDTVPEPNPVAAMVKVYCSEVAVRVTHDALQIFGGYGYMRDLPLEKWARDARVTPIYDFTNDMLRANIILPGLAFATEV
ncbi:MAG TPA: acyl-CoA dehydrogenase family protein [Dehalococcoidia bacterium]|nr:acyl-CoA dehydrogenase family protein [Dehalococcoidia bacterium]